MECFSIDTYIARIEGSYTDAGKILSTANSFLDTFSTEEHAAWLEKGEGGGGNDDEQDEQDADADDEGWTEVKKRKLSVKALMKPDDAVNPNSPKPDKNPFLTKHTKKDFYQFQVTDRWRKKAERIAARLEVKRDYFGRVRSSRNFEKKT